MDFYNETNFSTLEHRTVIGEDKLAMSIQCRVMFDIINGEATVAKEQTWPLNENYYENYYGPMDRDDLYTRGGIDIMVFGHAIAPKGQTITQSIIEVLLNEKPIHKIKVFGDRVWKSTLGFITQSKPKPFKKIALTLNNAFGGVTKWDGLEIPYSANPYGKGYYHTKEEAVDNVLPNLEHVDKQIIKWKEIQEPAGVGSYTILPLKAKNSLELSEDKKEIKNIKSTFFNSAFPNLIVDSVKVGDNINVKGVTESGNFNIKIPNFELEIDISIGEASKKDILKIEQIGILPDSSQVFITYNYPFRYNFKPQEKRKTRLRQINN